MRQLICSVAVAITILGVLAGSASAQPMPVASWDEAVKQARGQQVNFFMWGGFEALNRFIDEHVGKVLNDDYGVKLNRIPIKDTVEAVNKVLAEKQAGKDRDGSVDLIWINGENFKTLRQANLIFGPWAQLVPNTKYVDWSDPSVANDFGIPVEGYESPWQKGQFVMIYDSAKISSPPRTIAQLKEWVQANPGKFTYSAPPDFSGTAFATHVLYETTGGAREWVGVADPSVLREKAKAAWQWFRDVRPALWRQGQTYPQRVIELDDLFANGEVSMIFSYQPVYAAAQIEKGKFPATTRTFVFEAGTVSNSNYVAIPYNAAHKGAGIVTANVLLSPAAQLAIADPRIVGRLPVIDPRKLDADDRRKLEALPRHPSVLPTAELAAKRVGPLHPALIPVFEAEWKRNVVQ